MYEIIVWVPAKPIGRWDVVDEATTMAEAQRKIATLAFRDQRVSYRIKLDNLKVDYHLPCPIEEVQP